MAKKSQKAATASVIEPDIAVGNDDDSLSNDNKGRQPTKKAQAEAAQQKFRRGIGLEAPPTYQMHLLNLSQLLVPDEESVSGRVTHSFAYNISLMGVLHPPTVVALSAASGGGDSGGDCYRVLTGRRRICAAREAGIAELNCHVYPHNLTPAQEAAIRLSENMRRSPYPTGEVLDLAELLKTNLVSERELGIRLGLSQATIKRRLKVAQLPRPLLDALRDGELSLALAEQISRLPRPQQLDLAEQVQVGGELLSDDQVKALHWERKNASFANLSWSGNLFGFGSTETETAKAKVGIEGEVEVGQSAATTTTLTGVGPEPWSATPPVLAGAVMKSAISAAECKDKLSQVLCFANNARCRAAHQVSLLVRAALLELDNLEV